MEIAGGKAMMVRLRRGGGGGEESHPHARSPLIRIRLGPFLLFCSVSILIAQPLIVFLSNLILYCHTSIDFCQ
jgi:hypothetical protein